MVLDPANAPEAQEAAPESPVLGARLWLRENLFSTRFNGVLTLIGVGIAAFVVRNFMAWAFAPNRGWEAVATNMRLLMTQAYPAGPEPIAGCPPELIGAGGACIENQFSRVWISVGVVVVLAVVSMAAWRVGSRMAASTGFRLVRNAGAVVALLAILGPPTVDLDLFADLDVPVIGFLIRLAGSLLSFVLESLLMTGGRLIGFLIGAALAIGGFLGARAFRRRKAGFHSLWVPAVGGALAIIALWVVPFGHYFFNNSGAEVIANGMPCGAGRACFEPGTIATSTKVPWTLIFLVGIGAYFVGRLLVRLMGDRVKSLMILGWTLALPVIVLFVLRDPDFNLGNPAGGFDFLSGSDITIWLLLGVVGGLLIAGLSFPRLGEVGRALSGVVLIAALAMWAFPMEMRARIIGLLLAAFAMGAPTFAGDRRARIRYVGLWLGLASALVVLFAAIDTPSTLTFSGKSFLGGLMLTFVLALTSITLSFPIGVLMALGRTSTMPIFRVVSTLYIELVRGIPFITVLIFFDLILVLFLPTGVEFDSVTLAIIAGTLFSAAYLAENVRGGLQSIPNGQYEAAKAMGLSTLQLTVFIVLPQALRAVIPALVGQTIAIFKDTSLVAIIGLFDLLFIADKVVPAQTIFLGIKLENIVFISLVYWLFTFSFSRASLRVEKKLGLGER